MAAILGDPEALAAEVSRRAHHRAVEIAEDARRRAAAILEGAKRGVRIDPAAIRGGGSNASWPRWTGEMPRAPNWKPGTAFICLREAPIDRVWHAAEEQLRRSRRAAGLSRIFSSAARCVPPANWASSELVLAADPVGHELLSAETLEQWSQRGRRRVPPRAGSLPTPGEACWPPAAAPASTPPFQPNWTRRKRLCASAYSRSCRRGDALSPDRRVAASHVRLIDLDQRPRRQGTSHRAGSACSNRFTSARPVWPARSSRSATTSRPFRFTKKRTALRPGEPLFGTGAPLSVSLGPGLLANTYDGLQRPLEVVRDRTGNLPAARFASRGAALEELAVHAPRANAASRSVPAVCWALFPRLR